MPPRVLYRLCASAAMFITMTTIPQTRAGDTPRRYYAHEAVQDANGVIAPWYRGQEGQLTCRIRIGAETLKRYPWSDRAKAATQVPEYLWSSVWNISPTGEITPGQLDNFMNGDRGQLAMYVLTLMPDYYRYSGDPAALAHALLEAEIVLNHGLTPADHPWPSFPVSVPVQGKPYGQVDPRGMIQLDIAAMMGYGMLRTYQLTGDERLLTAAKHWADLFASKCDHTPGAQPWGRYANPEAVAYGGDPKEANKLTGGVVWILYFLDEIVRLGYTGPHNEIVEARDAGRAYLKDTLLPAWLTFDTWGRHYWDWLNNVQVPNMTSYAVKYMLEHKDLFPNWRTDCRNLMSLCLNRMSVNPDSNGDVLSGAWAEPESCGCCGRCLSAMPGLIADAWARYGVEADSPWAREIARRMMILFGYDFHMNGVAEDNIDGGVVTNGGFFEAAQLAPMRMSLRTLAWMPETLGAARENHIVRSSAVVNSVIYGKGRIEYSTFDAPANTADVLRLAFEPRSVLADDRPIEKRSDLSANGYAVKPLGNGDCLVTIRHDGARRITVEGADPGKAVEGAQLQYQGDWQPVESGRVAGQADASASFAFEGNQVQLLGRVSPDGGLADVYLDGNKQLPGIDCWNPTAERQRQVLYYTSGLENRRHELRVVCRGAGNPRSKGTRVCLQAAQWSDAVGDNGFGAGGGPTGPQRMIFGYPKAADYRDAAGNEWGPGCEFVVRSGAGADPVGHAWWTTPTTKDIAGTQDPELYRYGVHAPEFTVYSTVGPGTYRARLMFAASTERPVDTSKSRMTVFINDRKVIEDLDVAARAGGAERALSLDFPDLAPLHGTIAIRFVGTTQSADGKTVPGEAFVQAMEIETQPGTPTATRPP